MHTQRRHIEPLTASRDDVCYGYGLALSQDLVHATDVQHGTIALHVKVAMDPLCNQRFDALPSVRGVDGIKHTARIWVVRFLVQRGFHTHARHAPRFIVPIGSVRVTHHQPCLACSLDRP